MYLDDNNKLKINWKITSINDTLEFNQMILNLNRRILFLLFGGFSKFQSNIYRIYTYIYRIWVRILEEIYIHYYYWLCIDFFHFSALFTTQYTIIAFINNSKIPIG